jgi:DNA polymerase-3 subunit epsilon
VGVLASVSALWRHRSGPTVDERLTPLQRDRLQRLTERAPPPLDLAHAATRYVTVDVETTGLDMRHDRLLSIGAAAVQGEHIELAQCFHVVLRQPASSSTANILVHRIGGQRQLQGVEPIDALLDFLEFTAGAPLVAYRAEFDRSMLDRALHEHLGIATQSLWIDLAELLPALYPSNECRTMDDWLQRFSIRLLQRHDALADALATAQMLLVVLQVARGFDMLTPRQLDQMQRAQRWLGKR